MKIDSINEALRDNILGEHINNVYYLQDKKIIKQMSDTVAGLTLKEWLKKEK